MKPKEVEKWRNDPDCVISETGEIYFIGPGARQESIQQHEARLAHNARMRFHRQVQGLLMSSNDKVGLKFYSNQVGVNIQLPLVPLPECQYTFEFVRRNSSKRNHEVD